MVGPSDSRIETVMMAFLPLTSVLHHDKTLLRLGEASHDDLPAQILPFPPSASHLYQNATIQNIHQACKLVFKTSSIELIMFDISNVFHKMKKPKAQP